MRHYRLLLTFIIGAALAGCGDDSEEATNQPALELNKNLCSDAGTEKHLPWVASIMAQAG